MLPKATTPTATCEYCGKSFRPHHLSAGRFCTTACWGFSCRVPLEQRFWSFVQKTDTCWLWTGGSRGSSGHGGLRADGRGPFIQAHRLSWELHRGPIPDGFVVLHHCEAPKCVRPDHLFLGGHPLTKGRPPYQKPSRESLVLLLETRTQKEVAEALDVGYHMVSKWAKSYGLQRTRAEVVRRQWMGNPERREAQAQRMRDWCEANPEETLARSVHANLVLQQTSPTSIERALMVALDAENIPYVFQYVVGSKFLCDFAFPDARLIVECDGSYWHRTTKQRRRDTGKDAYLGACGYTVLRFTDTQLRGDAHSCVQTIKATLEHSQNRGA